MIDKSIPRQAVRVTVFLSTGKITPGEIQIDLDSRLSDFMNLPERFFVLCDENNAYKIINKDHVVDIDLQ